MKLRPAELIVNKEDPFADDLLERKPLGERLANFLTRVEGPFTMALTGGYGSGKTHFLVRCKALLEQNDVPTVLLNAWETDFAVDPLAPIISELADKFGDKLKPEDRRWKKAKNLAAKVATASIPIALKIASAGILKAEDFTEGAAVGDAVEKMAEKEFEKFAAAKKSVDGLKRELARLTEQIRTSETKTQDIDGQANDSPVIVFVDELDRCRPSYSIEVLEVMKHFFEIPGIVFVLAIDRAQLVSAAKAVFGSGLDGDGYLRRFIDLEFSLPAPNVQNFCLNLAPLNSTTFRWDKHLQLRFEIARLCEKASFSLRKTQQFFTRATIAAVAASALADPQAAVFFVFLRELDNDLYNSFIQGKITAWEVLTRLREIDPEFGYPQDRGGIPFIYTLAGIGQDESPKPFLDLLAEDFQNKEIKFNFDRLRNSIRGSWRPYVAQIASSVDFCATFVT